MNRGEEEEMLKTVTRLLFGGEEKTPNSVKPGDLLEEEWHVVSHQDVEEEHTDLQMSTSADHGDKSDISVVDPEPTDPSSPSSRPITDAVPQPKSLVEAELTVSQKARTRADRHDATRNAILCQNRIRHGVHNNCFHLQQPGRRGLGH